MFKSAEDKLSKTEKIIILLFLLIILFIIYAYKLFSMQIIQGEHYKSQSQKISSQVTIIPAQRGEIFDRNADLPMVINTDSFAVEVIPGEIPPQKYDTVIQKLANYLDINLSDLIK